MSVAAAAVLASAEALEPDHETALILRAAVPSGEHGRRSLHRFRSLAGDPLEWLGERSGRFGAILPPLAYATAHNEAELDLRLRRGLETAALREQRRYAAIEGLAERALMALRRAGCPAVLVGGVAVALTAYPRPSARHCGDLNLGVPPSQLEAAGRALGAEGVAAEAHGLPIRLEPRPSRGELRAPRVGPAGARVPGPAELLVRASRNLIAAPARVAVALVDGWFLVRDPLMDWDDFDSQLVREGAAPGAYLMLRGLRDALGEDLDAELLNRVQRQALAAAPRTLNDPVRRLRAQLGARRMLGATRGFRARIAVAGRLAAASSFTSGGRRA